MKKVLSVLFLLVMLLTAVMPMALAEDANEKVPAAEETDNTNLTKEESTAVLALTVSADRTEKLYNGKVVNVTVTVSNKTQQAIAAVTIANNVNSDVWKIEELAAGEKKKFTMQYTFAEDENDATADKVIEFTANANAEKAADASLTLAPYKKAMNIGDAAILMLKGMVGIFLVTGLIILVLVIMDKVGNRKKETEE